ncbi:hypothetical protein ARMGADRAFT_1016241 [Armillaria gallica]|uniref:Uncharacterized protein n=1 Tax=Armillaria gallica TaxID=47427 RepID=A0A2H3D3G4_ARMGA|nr:hypothetical protein ARMGADRAFT_1016241 [Armillaria gallica]
MGRQHGTKAGSGSKPRQLPVSTRDLRMGDSSQRVRVPSHMKPPKVSQPDAPAPSQGDTKSSQNSAR